ncbi:MAG TPA: hypothetical protein VFZ70_01715 [Euzebyales bacterium]
MSSTPRQTVAGADGDTGRKGKRSRSRYRRVVWLATLWTLTVLAFTAWGLYDVIRARSTAGAHAVDHGSDYRYDATAPEVPAQLTPRGDPENLSAVLFHRDLSQRIREIEYEASVPQEAGQSRFSLVIPDGPLETRIGQFADASVSRELDKDYITADAEVRQNRVLLRVAFDRRSAALGSPGSYLGTISVVDPRVERVDIPFTVSLAYPWWQFVCVLLLLMLLPATLYLWFLRGSFSQEGNLSLAGLQNWLFSRNALMSIGTGIAAAVSVWMATYFSSDSWGVSVTAATAMFGATFSSFIAAASAVTAAGAEEPTTAQGGEDLAVDGVPANTQAAPDPVPA